MTKILNYYALSAKVLAVAVEGSIGDWSAYIDAVEGKSHEREKQQVAENGSKLRKEIAEVLFPYETEHYDWRE